MLSFYSEHIWGSPVLFFSFGNPYILLYTLGPSLGVFSEK